MNKRLQFLNVDENNKQICYRNCCKLKTVAFFSYRIRVVQDMMNLIEKISIRWKFEEAEGLYQIDEHWAAGIDKVLIA